MFRERERERIAVGAHRVIGERGALPRLDAGGGRGAARDERGGGEQQGEEEAGAHGIWEKGEML